MALTANKGDKSGPNVVSTDMMPSISGPRRRTCKEVRLCGQPMSEVYSSHCPRKVNIDPEHHYTLYNNNVSERESLFSSVFR